MSLTTDITNLTAQVSQLIQTVDQQDDVVRQKISQLAAMVPNTARTYYVDAINGDDANDGLSPDTSFATLHRALQKAPAGGICNIRLLSDVQMTYRWPLQASMTYITGWDRGSNSQTRRSLRFAGSAGLNRGDGWIAGVTHLMDGVLWLEMLDVYLPQCDSSVTSRRDVITHWRGGVTVLWGCNVLGETGVDSNLVAPAHGQCFLQLVNSTQAANVGPGTGRMFAGVAANANPNDDWRITTNITQN